MTIRRPIDAFVSDNPVSQLNDHIRRFSEPSFDRWNNVVYLKVYCVTITRPLLESMIEFMNLPFAKDPNGTTNEGKKWIWVEFHNSRFDHNCTLDDICRLFLAIDQRAAEVGFEGSGEVLSRFLSIDHDDAQLEASRLCIGQIDALSAQQCAQLGDMIQRSIHLRVLSLCVRLVDGAHEVFAALANAIELQKLSIYDGWSKKGKRKQLGDVVVGENGDGPLIRLLLNPQNQMKELTLRDIGMKDHHLIAILQSIPNTQIEHLDFSYNLIKLPGMLEFGNLLPKMKSLKKVYFGNNPWEDLPADDRKTIGAALLQGMTENMSIENMYGTERTRQARSLWHFAVLNRAGRRVVLLSQPIADGLWPLILARAGPNLRFWVDRLGYGSNKYNARANIIYYFLPSILSLR